MDGETHKSRQRLPFFRPRGATNRVPEGQTGSPLGSVGAYWPPLTPEHGFPSLLYAARAQGAPPLPAPGQAGAPMCLLTLPSERIKNRVPGGHPVWSRPALTLRWHDPHQVKGRSAQLPLSPLPQAPLSLQLYYGPGGPVCQEKFSDPGAADPGGKEKAVCQTSRCPSRISMNSRPVMVSCS